MPPRLELPDRILAQLMALLELHLPEAEVWAYGSRVGGNCHEASDLDIVIRNPASLSTPQRGLGTLRGAFSESNIPILVDVHDWARLPESFQSEIMASHVVLKAAGQTARNATG